MEKRVDRVVKETGAAGRFRKGVVGLIVAADWARVNSLGTSAPKKKRIGKPLCTGYCIRRQRKWERRCQRRGWEGIASLALISARGKSSSTRKDLYDNDQKKKSKI